MSPREQQPRTAAGQKAGRFDAEIVPIDATMAVLNKEPKGSLLLKM